MLCSRVLCTVLGCWVDCPTAVVEDLNTSTTSSAPGLEEDTDDVVGAAVQYASSLRTSDEQRRFLFKFFNVGAAASAPCICCCFLHAGHATCAWQEHMLCGAACVPIQRTHTHTRSHTCVRPHPPHTILQRMDTPLRGQPSSIAVLVSAVQHALQVGASQEGTDILGGTGLRSSVSTPARDTASKVGAASGVSTPARGPSAVAPANAQYPQALVQGRAGALVQEAPVAEL